MRELKDILNHKTDENIKQNSFEVKPDFGKIKMFSVSKRNSVPSNFTDKKYEEEVTKRFKISEPLNTKKPISESVIEHDDLFKNNIDKYVKDVTDLSEIKNYISRNSNYISLDISNSRSKDIVKCMSYKIREYIKDSSKMPRVIFAARINEFVKYINTTKYTKLVNELPVLLNYLKEYIENYITTKTGTESNILIELGITRYISNRSNARLLQRNLTKAKSEVLTRGTISTITQRKLWDSFSKMFKDLINGLMIKVKDKNKKELFTSVLESIESNNISSEEEGIEDGR